MNRQLELFSGAIAPTVGCRRMTFEEFHKLNPHIYCELVKLARWYRDRGQRRLSMRALFEILRMRFIETRGGGKFRLNNNDTSRYARLLMEREPDLDGLFELRDCKQLT